MMANGYTSRPALMALFGMLWLAYPFTPAWADTYQAEFIPFAEITTRHKLEDVADLNRHETTPAVNFFYSANYGQWRLLGEFFVSDHEQELERLSVGWVTEQGARIWAGRYHTGIGHWNRRYHHGAYLQTSIDRPALFDFEEFGGVLPSHASGVTIEGELWSEERIISYVIDAGLGPTLGERHLEPFDLLDPDHGTHKPSIGLQLSLQSPNSVVDETGLFIAHTVITTEQGPLEEIQQTALGIYAVRAIDAYTLSSSLVFVHDREEDTSGSTDSESFWFAYLQAERSLHANWTVYGRAEGTQDAKDNLFIQQIPAFIYSRGLLGVRYQLGQHQSVKFELAKQDQYGEHFYQTSLQWSAAIP